MEGAPSGAPFVFSVVATTMWNSRKSDKGFTLIELLIVVAIIGILAAIAIPNLLTAMQRARQKRTMSDMRNLAIAWEARATEMNSFSGAASGGRTDYTWPASPITYAELKLMLQPTYIRALPDKDGWGTLYDFAADQDAGSTLSSNVYGVRSYGRDGKVDGTLVTGPTSNFSCDIIYSNGSFVAYPEGVVIN